MAALMSNGGILDSASIRAYAAAAGRMSAALKERGSTDLRAVFPAGSESLARLWAVIEREAPAAAAIIGGQEGILDLPASYARPPRVLIMAPAWKEEEESGNMTLSMLDMDADKYNYYYNGTNCPLAADPPFKGYLFHNSTHCLLAPRTEEGMGQSLDDLCPVIGGVHYCSPGLVPAGARLPLPVGGEDLPGGALCQRQIHLQRPSRGGRPLQRRRRRRRRGLRGGRRGTGDDGRGSGQEAGTVKK